MNTIRVACPAGSGMNFATNLLRPSFAYKVEFLMVGHERKNIIEQSPTLVILRNPYDTIGSGTERFLKSAGHEYFKNSSNLISEDNPTQIVEQLCRENDRYVHFFKNIEDLKHVKVMDFDTLTKNPDLFVNQVAKFFDIQHPIIKVPEKEVIKSVIESGNANRVPREKNPGRIKIDRYIKAVYPEDEFKALDLYLDLKCKINEGVI
jgi:hypothetical protein